MTIPPILFLIITLSLGVAIALLIYVKLSICKHIWIQTDDKYFLRKSREKFGEKWGVPAYSNFEYYATPQKCECCGNTKLVETRALII
jgi:hypothetical protein